MLSYILSFFKKQEKFQNDEDPKEVVLTQDQSKLPGEYKLYRPEQDPRFLRTLEITRKERADDQAVEAVAMVRENLNKFGNGVSSFPRLIAQDTRNCMRDNRN
jgi:hypothetical protein